MSSAKVKNSIPNVLRTNLLVVPPAANHWRGLLGLWEIRLIMRVV